MESEGNLNRFAKYAWFVLGYNVLVILWGVFLRASKSGDGCGQHWLTCGGEVVPSAPQLKTIIEFSHRITSALDGLVVVALLIWAYLIWRRERTANSTYVLKMAAWSFVFVLIEGAVGAGLVLTGNTAETLTAARPFWMAGHLLNTLILLTLLTVTAWSATVGHGVPLNSRTRIKWIAAVAGSIFLVSVTGSVAALSSMIFPAGTITEGITKDFSPTSHMLLRLRPLHPILAVATAVFVVFWTGLVRKNCSENGRVLRLAKLVAALAIVQVGFGAMTLLMLGPILMQLGHLLLADAIWVSFVLLSAELLTASAAHVHDADLQSEPASTMASSES